MHAPKQGEVVDFDAVLDQELFEIAIRQTEAEIPRTANIITSGGNRNLANADRSRGAGRDGASPPHT